METYVNKNHAAIQSSITSYKSKNPKPMARKPEDYQIWYF